MKLKPSTLSKILELRDKFSPISNISYQYSAINKNYPLNKIDEETAQEVIKEYERLLERVKKLKDFFDGEN